MKPNLCKIKKRIDPSIEQGGSSAKIFVTKKGEIIKSIKKNKDKEKYNLVLLKKKLTKKDSIFFNPYIDMKTCQDGNYYLMKKLDGDLINLLHSDKKLNLKNILLQLLVGVYILNHKIKLYHNDLFFEGKTRNVMYVSNNNKNIIYENNFIKLKIRDYLIKIIDFGHSNKEPNLRTLQYKNQYFKELKLTSEVLLNMHYYFQSLYLKNNNAYYEKLEEKTLKLGKRLEKKSNYNLKIFDQLVIKYIKNNFKEFLNLAI